MEGEDEGGQDSAEHDEGQPSLEERGPAEGQKEEYFRGMSASKLKV